MSGREQLRIGDVVNRTGLSERMIRHYEQLGLVTPARSESGQRLYDTDAFLALAKVSLLKEAGLPLNLIRQWLENPMDARNLIAAQLAYLRSEASRIAGSIATLTDLDHDLATGKTADIDDLASIIRSAGNAEDMDRAKSFFEAHFTTDQGDGWQIMLAQLRAKVDPEAYERDWRALITDIKAALPLDPGSEEAQAFIARWEALLEPFRQVASDEQQEMARKMWTNVGEWGGAYRQPASQDVMDFVTAAYAARKQQSSNLQS